MLEFNFRINQICLKVMIAPRERNHGAISDSFLQVMMVKKMQETDTENEIREAYRVFDKERTGGIAVSEMRLILSNLPEKLSDEEIEEMLQTADKDGNGYFSYDEFRMMIGATLSMKLK